MPGCPEARRPESSLAETFSKLVFLEPTTTWVTAYLRKNPDSTGLAARIVTSFALSSARTSALQTLRTGRTSVLPQCFCRDTYWRHTGLLPIETRCRGLRTASRCR